LKEKIRELEADESGKAFDRAFKKIAPGPTKSPQRFQGTNFSGFAKALNGSCQPIGIKPVAMHKPPIYGVFQCYRLAAVCNADLTKTPMLNTPTYLVGD